MVKAGNAGIRVYLDKRCAGQAKRWHRRFCRKQTRPGAVSVQNQAVLPCREDLRIGSGGEFARFRKLIDLMSTPRFEFRELPGSLLRSANYFILNVSRPKIPYIFSCRIFSFR